MILDGLLELVKTLRARIDEHRAVLSGNEMLTRYALIDPLLRELGWDTSDPATVAPEDTSGVGRGRPDYVLFAGGQPVMVVEAKKLGGVLHQSANQQAVGYAMDSNRQARFFAITDGQNWEIFDTQKPASDMSIISFDLMASSAGEACLKTLALWRPSVAEDSVSEAQAPIIQPHVEDESDERPEPTAVYSPAPTQPEPRRTMERSSEFGFGTSWSLQQERPSDAQPAQQPAEVAAGVDNGDWIALTELNVKGGDPPPSEIQFPDGSSSRISRWNRVMIESVRWLVNSNLLDQRHYPVQVGRRNIISDKPIHPNGAEFKYSRSVGSLYVETSYSSPHCVRNAIVIIQRTGQDPAQFKVRFANSPSPSRLSAPAPFHTSVPARAPVGGADYGNSEWIPISNLNLTSGDNRPSPLEVQFPDNRRVQATRWTHVMRETIRWLIDNHHLDRRHCPIQHASRYIIADSPIHPTGTEFRYITEIKGYYIEMNTSPPSCIRNSRLVIERTGQDPAQFKVRFADQPAPSRLSAPAPTRSYESSDNSDWIALTDLNVSKGHPRPIEIQFPDGSSSQIKTWNRVMTESVRWLMNSNLLDQRHYPVQVSSRYVLSDKPIHPNGAEFKSIRSVGSLYVETNYSSPHCVRNAIIIIQRTGQIPAQFKLRFSS